ncbi:MAG: succinylglutamate desuccinylase/aspartoacylase family protein [Deltaproteobacteria bacterium]|nr:succinylglutamate desuccinylase/aspartoacylase family protein [Deltaproteobacteria bacterium]
MTSEITRVVGRVRGERPGPTLIVVGGIHGNEPGGVIAARRVLARIDAERIPIRGELLCLAGNVGALREKKRYLARDLNRLWTPDRVGLLPANGSPTNGSGDPEATEQRELSAAIEEALANARGEAYLVDLHTTSAEGIPFALIGDTLRHREFASHFPLPVILGLEEQVDGILVEHMTHRGCVTLVVEGGQHQNPVSWEHLEAVLWLALAAAGNATAEAIADHHRHYAQLERARGSLPRVMEVTFRHPVGPADQFRMMPGFANIARVRRHQLLARDRRGEIRAPSDGMVFLPLYQPQGDDGFFLGRGVSGLRMQASAVARRLRLDRLLPLLPGVRRDPERRDRLDVDTEIARLYPMDVFHLFGYRKVRQRGAHLEVARRPHDPE